MTNAFTTAFGTASSSATLPVTINLLEEKNGVDPRIARFDRLCLTSAYIVFSIGLTISESSAASS